MTLDKRVCFILSSTRSGSTWLALMLGSNSRAVYAGELNRMFRSPPDVCSLCAERGLACPFFTDIDRTRRRAVHAEILARTGKDVVVDNSKSISWAKKQTGTNLRTQYIHLLRDPRAVVHAWQQRNLAKGVNEWAEENDRLLTYLEASNADFRVMSYDQLAASPPDVLGPVCAWLGLDYEPGQEAYWATEHHGVGSNGATAAFLERFTSTDREYYARTRRTRFHDLRWQKSLDRRERAGIEANAGVASVLERTALSLSDDGLLAR